MKVAMVRIHRHLPISMVGNVTHFNLFVYGTLTRGASGAAHMEQCTFRAAASVPGLLYDIDGMFPALLMYGDTRVHGEVWSCPSDLLLSLDEYEGTARGLFRRVAVEATTELGETLPCWVYAAGPLTAAKLTADNRIPSGVWTA